MSKSYKINHLASSVLLWLNYTTSVGRDFILSESAIKIPVAEYLNITDIHDLQLEYSHPKFSSKRFDLFFEEITNVKNTMEFKFIKNDSTRAKSERQRIFDDLMRLYFFLDFNRKGYFLICGSQLQFGSNFEKLDLNPSNYILPKNKSNAKSSNNFFFNCWFSFDMKKPDKTIDLKTTDLFYKEFYDDFSSNYSDSFKKKNNNAKLLMPSSILTKLIYISDDFNEAKIPYPSKIGVWEISK